MNSESRPYKLAYFVSHPIQYQAPLLKLISQQIDIDLTVFFLTDISTKEYKDAGFGNTIKWDIPLLEGYHYKFLDSEFSGQHFTLNNPNVKFKSVKKAINAQPWDAVWLHGYGNLALLYAAYLCRQKDIPLMLRGESNLVCTQMGFIKTIFIKVLLKRCNALLSIGSDNHDYYHHYGVEQARIFSVPYAVDNNAFQKSPTPPKTIDASCNNKTIGLFASKFIERKHPLLLIEAFNDLPTQIQQSAELWFIGDGEQRTLMENYISRHDLQGSVKLLGFKNQTELAWYFSQCDVFILPSEKEPFGLVVNEVMNQAKAVITTDEVGAARDLVHQDNGWVIEAGSKKALSNALEEAFSNPSALTHMGQKSLEIIKYWSFNADVNGLREALNYISVVRN